MKIFRTIQAKLPAYKAGRKNEIADFVEKPVRQNPLNTERTKPSIMIKKAD